MSAPVREGDILAGKYKVERVLAHGGMGVVVAAIHQQLEQRVALKFLLPEEMKNESTVGRFLLEAKAAVRLRSEHVARVLDVGTAETGSPYIVMEYLDGRDLSAILADGEPMSVTSAVSYVLQACEAVAEAHALGIVHRDLKPANLFLTHRADGTPCVKVLDFGVSKLVGRELNMTKTNAVIGTPFYMAPEQLRSSRDADVRSDIWALGMVLYELLTGNVAFERDTLPELCMAIMTMPTPAPREKRPDIPPALEAVILRALAKEPADRYPTLAELARALAPFSPLGPASEKRIGRVLGEGRPVGTSDVPPPRSPGATALYASGPLAEATPPGATTREVDAFGVTTDDRGTPDAPVLVAGASRGPRWLLAGLAVVAIMGLVGGAVTLAGRARATGATSTASPSQTTPVRASAEEERTPLPPPTGAASVDPPAATTPPTASATPPTSSTAKAARPPQPPARPTAAATNAPTIPTVTSRPTPPSSDPLDALGPRK